MRPLHFRFRVLADRDDTPASTPDRAGERHADFARLLRQAAHGRRIHDEREDAPGRAARRLGQAVAQEDQAPATVPQPRNLFHLDTPGSDYIQALARREAECAAVCSIVAAQVADFCAVPAVANGGRWNLRMVLDPALLPDCSLEMDLSYLHLMLRFDTGEAATRGLLLRNVDALKSRLSALLERHASIRDLEIKVW